jgi:hypothetical protein
VAIATIGYVIYGIGAATPYLRAQLGLSDAQLGLHSTAMAVGLLAVGVGVARLDRRLGEVTVRGLAILLLSVGVVGLATAIAFGATLASAVLIGAGTGTLLGYGNAALVRPGGALGRVRVARANVWAMVAAFVCPVLLAGTVAVGIAFGWGLAPALGLLAVLALDLRAGPRLAPDSTVSSVPAATGDAAAPAARHLPRAYWLAWTFLVAAIAVEFSIVQWAATLIASRTGADTAQATLLAGLFLGGMFVGRLAQSAGIGSRGGVRRPAAIFASLALAGVIGTWLATVPLLAGLAIFVAGTGVAGLYPLGVAGALSTAPDRLALAGSRLTLASGLAVLLAPLTLGIVADAAGVVTGWVLVVAAAVAALALVAALPAGERSA